MTTIEAPAVPSARDRRAQDLDARPREGIWLSRADRIGERTQDIANRLRFICASMPDDELLALASRMAVLAEKYDA